MRGLPCTRPSPTHLSSRIATSKRKIFASIIRTRGHWLSEMCLERHSGTMLTQFKEDDVDSNRRGILHKELSNICPLASVRMTSRVGFPCAPGSRLYSSNSWEHYYNSHISRGIKRPNSGLRCTFWAYDALVLAAPNLVDMCGASRQDRWLPRSSSLAPSS
jgi:hypothetical protein